MRRWGMVITKFVSVNIFVQAVGLVVGVLIVRGLDKGEYGYYAVFTSIIAAFILVSDSGVAGTLISALGRDPHDDIRAGELIRTTLFVQRRVAVLVAAACSITLIFVLTQLGASPITTASVLIAFLASATLLAHKSVYQAYRRVNSEFKTLQSVAGASAGFRLLCIVSLSLLRLISLPIVLLVNALSYIVEFLVIRAKDRLFLSGRGTRNADFTQAQWATVRRTLPMSLAIVAQTQLLTLSLGVFGSADVLAEVSALSRFAAVLAIVGAVVSDVGTGLVARAHTNVPEILRRYSACIALLWAASAVAIALIALFSNQLLSLLGPGYAGLSTPLIVVAAGTAGIMTADALRVLNQARGWTRYSWTLVPAIGIWFGAGIVCFDLTNVTEASIWMALQALTGLGTQGLVLVAGLRSISAAEDA